MKPHRIGRELAAALLVAVAMPAMAVPVPVPLAPATPDPRSTIVAAFALGQAGDCKGALAKLDPLVATLPQGAVRNSVQLLRLNCLGPAGRAAELAGVQRELAEADPRNPIVRGFGVIVAADAGDMKSAGEQLARLAEQTPAGLAGLSGRLWRAVAQTLTQTQETALRDRISIALARADWQPGDLPNMRSDLAESAIDVLVRRGEVAEAELLLPRVTTPESLFQMAMLRAYAPVWPLVEARLGPQSATAIDAFARDRLAAFTATPDDAAARLGAVRALMLLGRQAEASETAASVAVIDGMDEDAVTTVRLDSQAQGIASGRPAAIARLRPFATLDLARTPVAVSGAITLAETLDEAGQAAEALDVARSALARGSAALSPWGRGWLKRTEICTLATLGRRAEAEKAAETLRTQATDNPAAAIEASLCVGQGDAALPVLKTALATVDGPARLADQFQPQGAFGAANPSRLRGLWVEYLKRPAVKTLFERAARILPKTLWPSAEPRPIPRTPTTGRQLTT